MLKKIIYHAKNNLIGTTIMVFGGALLGFIINYMVVIMFNVDNDNTSAMIMTLMAIMLGIMCTSFVAAFWNVGESNLAITMSQTRKKYWTIELISSAIELLWMSILVLIVFGIDHFLQNTLFAGYELEMNMTSFFQFFMKNPGILVISLVGIILMRLLIESLMVRIKGKGFFIIWIAFCMSISLIARQNITKRFVEAILEYNRQMHLSIAGMLVQLLVVCAQIVIIAFCLKSLNKQEVQ